MDQAGLEFCMQLMLALNSWFSSLHIAVLELQERITMQGFLPTDPHSM